MLAGVGLDQLPHMVPCQSEAPVFSYPVESREGEMLEASGSRANLVCGPDSPAYQNWKESASGLLCLPVFSLDPGLGVDK